MSNKNKQQDLKSFFGMNDKQLMKEIKEIKDYDKPKEIKNAIKISNTIEN